MRTALGWLMGMAICGWASAGWTQEVATGGVHNPIVSVGPVHAGSSVYQASYEVYSGSSPVEVDHVVVRTNGQTIDLVSYVNYGIFSALGGTGDTQTLGALAPGDYTLRLWIAGGDFSGVFGPEALQDTVQFTAVAGTEQVIPTLDRHAVFALAALMLLVGVAMWRRRAM